jgi:glycosyltransferase involved in cell wall biosynthesis
VPPERLKVFGGAAALDVGSATALTDDALGEVTVSRPFVLRYGGYTKRKNVDLLLDAWARVPIGTLVLCGPPQPQREEMLQRAQNLERVVVLDYVPSPMLAALLRTSSALVTTSEYEGFGLPALEALTAGTPVIATQTDFAREVCGDAALLVEPQAQRLADAITRVMSDDELVRRLSASGRGWARQWSWSRTASRVRLAYREALSTL